MATLSVGYRYQNSNDGSSQVTAFDVMEKGLGIHKGSQEFG